MLAAHTGDVLDKIAELVAVDDTWFYQPWPAELTDMAEGMSGQYRHRSFSVRYIESAFRDHDQGSASRRLQTSQQPFTEATFEVIWFAFLQMDDAHESYITTLNLQDDVIAKLLTVPVGAPVRLSVTRATCALGSNFDARGSVRVRATFHTDLRP